MTTPTVDVQDVRKDPERVIALVRQAGEVILTSNGVPVVTLTPIGSDWDATVAQILKLAPEPRDSGLTELLAIDDANSMDDLT